MLVPAEPADELVEVSLPEGSKRTTRVGDQPILTKGEFRYGFDSQNLAQWGWQMHQAKDVIEAQTYAADPDYLLTVADVEGWENSFGPLAVGAWLLLRTGWESRGHSQDAFLGIDDTGSHTPGVAVECAEWLAGRREITGLGVETVGVDAGLAGGFDPAFPVHNYFLGNDKYGLTSLRNLGRLPATGAMIVVSPLPIVGGTGSPSRVLAIVDSAPPEEIGADQAGV